METVSLWMIKLMGEPRMVDPNQDNGFSIVHVRSHWTIDLCRPSKHYRYRCILYIVNRLIYNPYHQWSGLGQWRPIVHWCATGETINEVKYSVKAQEILVDQSCVKILQFSPESCYTMKDWTHMMSVLVYCGILTNTNNSWDLHMSLGILNMQYLFSTSMLFFLFMPDTCAIVSCYVLYASPIYQVHRLLFLIL